MVDPQNRMALRRGLPWVFFGFLALVVSLMAWILEEEIATRFELTTLQVASNILGLFGETLFALGLSAFVRQRRRGPGGRWLDVALVLWLAELGLRAAVLIAPERLMQLSVGVRIGLVAGSLCALASWMRRVWNEDGTRSVVTFWSATRAVFLMQIAGLIVLATVPGARELLPERFANALIWLLFLVPWIVLYVALRRTMRALSRQLTVSDVLTG